MKKRMFITTIVMMLVLAVALTTSSLAWFSSANTVVTATTATFTAATASSSSLNLKISDTTGGWGNNIALHSGSNAGSLSPLVPTAPLISDPTVGADIETTGVVVNGQPVAVTHKGYQWPATMSFNLAKIGSESNFIIDTGDNAVQTYSSTARKDATNYYFDYFFIQNAGSQNAINTLTFDVSSALTTTGSAGNTTDYTARGYVAFILFDQVKVLVDTENPIKTPANAMREQTISQTTDLVSVGNLEVIPSTGTAAEGKIVADVDVGTENEGVIVWVPFCAFTFCTDKLATGTYQEEAWQFADLDAKYQGSNNEAPYYDTEKAGQFVYQNANISSLKTQEYDSLTTVAGGAAHAFVLNSANLKKLNNKVVNASGNVVNTGVANQRTSETGWDYDDPDTANVVEGSVFIMQPRETFLVSMYYWLDGISVTEFTDTTVSEIGVTIGASNN